MSEIVRVKNVRQSFRTGFLLKPKEILSDVSLSVQKGSVCGFLGANGAGKTTLIHLLVGVKRPKRGVVWIGGARADTTEARSKIGYLPERPYFPDFLTGEQFLRYLGKLSGISSGKLPSRIDVVLRKVGMEHARKLPLRAYSKGMLQRVGIAQAILHEPELVVLDEPMSGLDPVGRREIRELIQELARDGRTVFFSSHVISDVEAICSQVVMIDKGKIVSQGSIGELLSQGPARTEVAFSGVELEQARGLFAGVEQIQDGFKLEVGNQTEVGSVLSKILSARGHVLWVQPQRPTLEDWFSRRGISQ